MTKMREGRGSLEAVAEEVGDVLATVRVVRNIASHLVEGKIKICERRMEKKIK
jgi:NTP pyrophosphatase (non-canonical NTP hydrolase)